MGHPAIFKILKHVPDKYPLKEEETR